MADLQGFSFFSGIPLTKYLCNSSSYLQVPDYKDGANINTIEIGFEDVRQRQKDK